MYRNKVNQVEKIVNEYLEGIYFGDTNKLMKCFASTAYLYGDIEGQEYLKSLDEYIEGVASRKSPSTLNEENKMDILGIEVLGNVAIVKLKVPMLGFNYYDFLSLSVINGEWKIVNKLFTHVG